MMKLIAKGKPYFAMVLQQLGFAGMYVLSESILKNGMNQYVLVVYRNLIGAAFVAPFAFVIERNKIPRVTLPIFLKIMALAFLDPVLQQNSFYVGTKLTSASYASSLENLLPAFTFLMALVLRLEKLQINKRFGQAKVIGTLVSIGGAILMILYDGPKLVLPWVSTKTDQHSSAEESFNHAAGSSKWIVGTLSLIGSTVFSSIFLILQSNTLESFSTELTMSTMICFFGAFMSAVVALVVERGNLTSWIIGWDNRLFVVIYSGVMCSGISYYLQGMVMKERGPVFASFFGPLIIILTAIIGSFILSDPSISLGMTIGATIMVAGLYAFLWGKSKDTLSPKSLRHVKAQELPITESKFIDTSPNMEG